MRRWTAVVSDLGCTLRSLTLGGRRLLSSPEVQDAGLGHHGAVLAPWPGRTTGARYRFDGEDRALPVNEPALSHALHGFALDMPWERTHADRSSATFRAVLGDRPGYPGRVQLRVSYTLDESGLCCESGWENVGDIAAPFGLGFHPYVSVDAGVIDDWTLHVPAAISIDSIPETKDVSRPRPAHAARDFTVPRLIEDALFSRAYGELERRDGIARARVTARDGASVELGVDDGFGWLQVFTADLPTPELARRGIAIEPQTCPPNAFNSGIDLQRLTPGESARAAWFLRRIAP